ncbi:MAG: endonuclease V [Zetaproteobacteria bacterium]|nr:MAG: endonuclease V [Zetaproteobacteria bacterium]
MQQGFRLHLRDDLHPWPQEPAEARAIQQALPPPVVSPLPPGQAPRRLLGLDCAFPRRPAPHAVAAALLWDTEEGRVLWRQRIRRPIPFPYRTGLLAFRELPLLLPLLAALPLPIDAILVDGQGIAHPAGIGSAAHLALWIEEPVPVVGVAKSHLTGSFGPLPAEAGARTPLLHRGRIVGAVVRSRTGCRPLFVSPGGHVDVAGAVEIVLRSLRGRRLPEPLRLADRHSRDG